MKTQEENKYRTGLNLFKSSVLQLEDTSDDYSMYYNCGSNFVDYLQSVGTEEDFIRDYPKENQELKNFYQELQAKSKSESKYKVLQNLDSIIEGILTNTGLSYTWEERLQQNEFDVLKTIAHDCFQNLYELIESNVVGENV